MKRLLFVLTSSHDVLVNLSLYLSQPTVIKTKKTTMLKTFLSIQLVKIVTEMLVVMILKKSMEITLPPENFERDIDFEERCCSASLVFDISHDPW